MTSAHGRTYARQYPCDGSVDNVEPTRLMPIVCYLSRTQSGETHQLIFNTYETER